jgi:hypothetical protein
VGTLAADSTSWTDTLASPGTTYFYRVRSSAAGPTYGPYSSEASTTTYASVPADLSASDGTYSTKIHLTWSAATGAVSYQLYRSTTNNAGTAGLLAPSSITSYDDTNATPGTTYYYWVAARDSLNRLTAKSASDDGLRAIDSTPPTVVSDTFDYISPSQPVMFTFSEDVYNSVSPSNITVQNLDTLADVPVIDASYDQVTNTASYFMSAILPDGRYRATLAGSQVSDAQGNPMGADVVLDFFVLAGDANHDATVDTTDFNILVANFGASPSTFDHGDFNYDNTVDSLDFNLLVANFSRSLASSGAAASATVPSNSLFGHQRIASDSLINDLLQ